MHSPVRTLIATVLLAGGVASAAAAAGPRYPLEPAAEGYGAFSPSAWPSLGKVLDVGLRERDIRPLRWAAANPTVRSGVALRSAVRLYPAPVDPAEAYPPVALPDFSMPVPAEPPVPPEPQVSPVPQAPPVTQAMPVTQAVPVTQAAPVPEAPPMLKAPPVPQAVPAPVTIAPAEVVVAATGSGLPPASAPLPPPPPPVTQVVAPRVRAQASTALEAVAGAAPAMLLPVDSSVGLAAFRLGAELLIVLDAEIDFGPPGPNVDPAFSRMVMQRTQDATVLRLPLAPSQPIRFARTGRGWVATLAPPDTTAGIRPILLRTGAVARVRMQLAAASRVVVVMDPQTGGRLLVGTQGTAGQALLEPSKQTQFALLPTLQGVVVAPVSDEIQLRREGDGFTLSAGSQPGDTIISDAEPHGADLSDASPVSQLLDLPGGTTQALSRRLAAEISRAAKAPAQARGAPRLRVAATMAALGMGVEAQSVLDVAAADDPALLDAPRAIGLRAVAAILAHRDGEADTLADPRLNGTDEITLWRALLHVSRDQASAADARALRAALPVLMSYSAPLRDRLLPIALETMALHGEADATQAPLMALADRRDLDLARGMAFESLKQPDAALRLYDQVAQRSDRLPRYRASVRAAELRMQTGALDAKGAADALDRILFGWRNVAEELPLRMTIARLRRAAGQWAEAMAVLREGRALFPDDHADFDKETAATFTALLDGDAARRMAPSAFVALYDKNLDLLQGITWTEPTATRLIDQLLSLGLQGRAEPVLARLLAQTRDPARRLALGARLAELRLNMDNPAGAIAALAETASPTAADPAITEQRQLLYARAEAARGNVDAAIAMLGEINTVASEEQLADLQTARKNWPQVVTVLTALERQLIPDPATLTPKQQALVMRIAEAATLGSDAATLARLSATYAAAMAKGDNAPLFRLIGSVPVRTVGDLPRAYDEIKLAQKVRANLGAKP